MIYSKIDNPKCATCANCEIQESGGNVLCNFKGTVPADYCCRKYKYDIFKKKIKPKKKLSQNKFSKDDFVV